MKGPANMTRSKDRKYYFVKHGLDAFQALPNFIWNSGASRSHHPRGFRQIKEGDRWIGFAHTSSDDRERPLSLVTGFFECVKTARYLKIPAKALAAAQYAGSAWFIEGRPIGRQPEQPVGVPSISKLLNRQTFNQTTFVPISAKEFAYVREYVQRHRFDPATIPLLEREPRYEQEVLAVVACGHKQLGIEKIVQARTAFPDLLVKLEGKRDAVYLELETYSSSFLAHRHHDQLSKRGLFPKNPGRAADKKPVAVLCWIDDNQGPRKARKRPRVSDYVHQIYELRELIRDSKKIRW
jgi:hypothetical protein